MGPNMNLSCLHVIYMKEEDVAGINAENKEALVGDGSVEVEKGQYIVIYCSQNSYEYGLKEGYDGDEDASYQCAFEE